MKKEIFKRIGFPEKKGLYDPSFEKDAAEAARRREQNIKTPDQRLDDLVGKAAKNLGIKLP